SLNIPGTRRFFGPALVELAQARSPTFPSHIELATIAGIGPLWKRTNPLLPFPNDGLVQVTEAHPDAILEHLTISSTHPGLVLQKRAFEIIHSFIATGRFSNYSE
ncbi:MAG: hypothetical protein KDD60_01090, partial [Bdellovibrionales bacterium]|nr:hypothetical protein [Bdellovibrionales bacterium]